MTMPSLLTTTDLARAAELRRVKLIATSVLVLSFVVFIVARILLPVHPVFGFVAAFAEAATIGGLADWYAVVALFKRPLGLPIPHTAIIQSNQARIADKLGEFIETHFLESKPVDTKLRQVDFARFIADWLSDIKRSADLSRFVLRLMPEAMAAVENSGLKAFAMKRVMAEAEKVDLAPLVTSTLRGFIGEGKHKGLLDDLMTALHEALNKPETMQAVRDKVRDELPTLLKLYRTDRFIVNRLVSSVLAFFDEVRSDPAHPFRSEFDRMALSLIDRFGSDPVYVEKLQTLKRDLLVRPEIATLARNVWDNARLYIEASAQSGDGVLQRQLAHVFVEAGRSLAADPEMRSEINSGVVVVARTFIADQKSGVTTFIADQVKAWDMRQLIGLIEVNIGRDLQYIRFNGSLIGGLAGLALYTIEVLLRLN